ncbi:MAG: methylated-DNA--[protein]-cysteine S-methyltransferase [Candidatus Handelsmanbacteria bacterium]|nr:methylated-DNA--[protein]-cysteine S-methyltransferase [Candidatus Handelsmanbacteria bacterium]
MRELELFTPLGPVYLRWRGGELAELHLGDFAPGLPEPPPAQGGKLIADLGAYFRGEAVDFGFSLPEGIGTPFQRRVWAALREIPRGRCATYGGLACGANPLPILVPCHRVVGATGELTGFSDGLPWKRALLQLEGVPLCNDQVLSFSLL